MATTQLPVPHNNLAHVHDDATMVTVGTPTGGSRRGLEESEWPRIRGYDVLSVIGTGGMANVYKARHRELRRIVAIKTIRARVLTDREFIERFHAEAEAVARLQHPNIIQVFEVGTVEARPGETPGPFIALEFVEGGCLSTRLGSPQSPRESAELVEKLARGAHAAHRVGVIHRDIKPTNVLMTPEGEPKIADFGVAKQLFTERDETGRHVTQAGTVMGTPEYMAPEQASSAPPTPAVDVYALGAILYEMLTARVPLTAATPLETMDLVRTQEPVSPRQLQPRLPRDLETICLKCLQKDPVRRYQTAEALADDLRRFLDDRPIQARRIGQIEKVARWARRNPLPAISLTSVAAMLLTAFVMVTLSYVNSETARQEESRQRDEAQRRERAERWSRYMADIVAAANAMQVYNVDGAARTLEASPEEHRNWEWRFFHNRRDLAQKVVNISNSAWEAQISADGRRVVVLCNDGIRVWDVVENRQPVAIERLEMMSHARLSPDGRYLAYRSRDREVVLHDVDTDQVRGIFRNYDDTVHSVDFTASGRQLLSGSSEQGFRVRDVETGELLRVVRPDQPHLLCVSLDANARTLLHAATGDDFIRVTNLDNGQQLAKIPNPKEHLQHVDFNAAGNWILTREFYPRSALRLWDAVSGDEIWEMRGHKNSIIHYAYSPDNTRIASASRDQSIGLWDISNKRLIAMLRGHLGCVGHVAFSPDGKRLVSAAEDHTVRIWDAHTGEALTVLTGHSAEVICVKYTSDGQNIVSASKDGTIRIWNAHAAETNNILRGHKAFVYSAAFHPNGELVASGSWDGTARIWNATTGREVAVLDHGDRGDGKIVSSVAFHPGGKILATRARNAVRLWDVDSGKEIHRWAIGNDGWRDTRLAFSHNGDLLAAGCRSRLIRIWNTESHKEVAVLEGHTAGVKDFAFSPDGRWLASVGDLETRIWDVATGKQVRTLKGHTEEGLAVAFNADGTILATSANDDTVRLWNVGAWNEIAELKHSARVYGLAFTGDGTRLACAGADNSIRFWDLATHQEVADLRGHTDYVHQIAFSPDCTRLVSASGDYTLRIWDTLSVQERAKR
jgi:WD40 repeat protein/serine/threonine protein kinase